jgi:hypothetical protein
MFKIDSKNSDDKYLYIDVEGRGTVVIKAEDEGIVVDIYPTQNFDNEPVATTWACTNELNEENA